MKLERSLKFIKEWWPFFAILAGAIILIYCIVSTAHSDEATLWLAKSFTEATMKDILGIGAILVCIHAILSKGDS